MVSPGSLKERIPGQHNSWAKYQDNGHAWDKLLGSTKLITILGATYNVPHTDIGCLFSDMSRKAECPNILPFSPCKYHRLSSPYVSDGGYHPKQRDCVSWASCLGEAEGVVPRDCR